MGELLTFDVFAGLMIVSALAVICAQSPVYSLLSLLVTMCCMAALFVLLGAVFLAALQILIYAGAILVLFLFVIMLLNVDRQALARARQFTGRWLALGLAALFLAQFAWVLRAGHAHDVAPPVVGAPSIVQQPGTIAAVGRALFHDYLLPFELTSLLILAAIVGAVALAQRRAD